jgi:hypothetical protein
MVPLHVPAGPIHRPPVTCSRDRRTLCTETIGHFASTPPVTFAEIHTCVHYEVAQTDARYDEAPPEEVIRYYQAALQQPGWIAEDDTGLRVRLGASGPRVAVRIQKQLHGPMPTTDIAVCSDDWAAAQQLERR